MQAMTDGQSLESLQTHFAYQEALAIVHRLRGAGHQAVLAGGCVRDGLLGVVPKDLDIATSAHPGAIEELFPRTLAVGKAFGTIVVVGKAASLEVTTFRREGPYEDGRRPSLVEFTDIREDAGRRDFTVNAMYFDPLTGQVLDFIGGMSDLRSRVLRTVGPAGERFAEDHLRMLRAIRFVAQLGFRLDREAVYAVQARAEQIRSVSAERILYEVKRMLFSLFLGAGLSELRLSRLEAEIWPELRAVDFGRLRVFGAFDSWENTYSALAYLAEDPSPEIRLRKWKASRESLKRVSEQLCCLRTLLNVNSRPADRARALGGKELAPVLTLASGALELVGRREALQSWIRDYLKVAKRGGDLPDPFVTGQDLISLGIEPGPRMGKLLKLAYDGQLEGEIRSKADAMERIRLAEPKV